MLLIWLGLRTVEIWRSPPPAMANGLDWTLIRAATIIVGLLIAHSFVDYPLRTGAMAAVMAFACALLIEPVIQPVRMQEAAPPKKTRLTDMNFAPSTNPAVAKPMSTPGRLNSSEGSLPPEERWGTDVNWPEEWSKASKSTQAEGGANSRAPQQGRDQS
jgi:hypothetical protein